MTATVSFPANSIVLEEIQWRNYAILANASKAIVKAAKTGRAAWFHYDTIGDLRRITKCMQEVVELLHAPESIKALEQAPREELARLGGQMFEVTEKIEKLITRIRSSRLGYWKRLYDPLLTKMKHFSGEIRSLIHTFSNAEAALVMMNKNDQNYYVSKLLDPPEPNEALRAAFRR